MINIKYCKIYIINSGPISNLVDQDSNITHTIYKC